MTAALPRIAVLILTLIGAVACTPSTSRSEPIPAPTSTPSSAVSNRVPADVCEVLTPPQLDALGLIYSQTLPDDDGPRPFGVGCSWKTPLGQESEYVFGTVGRTGLEGFINRPYAEPGKIFGYDVTTEYVSTEGGSPMCFIVVQTAPSEVLRFGYGISNDTDSRERFCPRLTEITEAALVTLGPP